MIKHDEALQFLATLSSRDWRKFTDDDFRWIEEFIKSDGCSGVIDFFKKGCILHDWCYRTHLDFCGNAITKAGADRLLRDYIRSKSWFGQLSPMAWWRWQGVKYLAEKPWENYGD